MAKEGSTGISLDFVTKPNENTRSLVFTVATQRTTWRQRFLTERFERPTLLTYEWSGDWGIKLFINGTLSYESETSQNIISQETKVSRLILGQTESPNAAYESFQIQDLTIWSRQQSLIEIQQRFQTGNQIVRC